LSNFVADCSLELGENRRHRRAPEAQRVEALAAVDRVIIAVERVSAISHP
jgi:hypothetical protein